MFFFFVPSSSASLTELSSFVTLHTLGFPWPQGERQPIVKVKPAELFLNAKPLNFASCTCPNYWSGYFAVEQQGLEVSDRRKNGSISFKKRFCNKFPLYMKLIHIFLKKCLAVKRKLESVTVSAVVAPKKRLIELKPPILAVYLFFFQSFCR